MLVRRPALVVLSVSAQLGDELPSRVLQGRGTAFAAMPAAAYESATELARGGDDQMREEIIG